MMNRTSAFFVFSLIALFNKRKIVHHLAYILHLIDFRTCQLCIVNNDKHLQIKKHIKKWQD